MRAAKSRGRSLVGERFAVEVGPVAHGGHFVARHQGRVVFVRHALPGERVVVEVTEGEDGSRFLRADAVEVQVPSPDRVEAPCPYAGPGRCGGCDFQHVALPAQRELKAAVVREQLARLGASTSRSSSSRCRGTGRGSAGAPASSSRSTATAGSGCAVTAPTTWRWWTGA